MADKEQIGLTPAGNAIMERILATGFFAEKSEVGRLAAALAIDAGDLPTPVKGTDTTWSTTTLDRAGDLQVAVLLSYPDTIEPFRGIEGLIDAGLRRIEMHLNLRGELVLPELLQGIAALEVNHSTYATLSEADRGNKT